MPNMEVILFCKYKFSHPGGTLRCNESGIVSPIVFWCSCYISTRAQLLGCVTIILHSVYARSIHFPPFLLTHISYLAAKSSSSCTLHRLNQLHILSFFFFLHGAGYWSWYWLWICAVGDNCNSIFSHLAPAITSFCEETSSSTNVFFRGTGVGAIVAVGAAWVVISVLDRDRFWRSDERYPDPGVPNEYDDRLPLVLVVSKELLEWCMRTPLPPVGGVEAGGSRNDFGGGLENWNCFISSSCSLSSSRNFPRSIATLKIYMTRWVSQRDSTPEKLSSLFVSSFPPYIRLGSDGWKQG